jgi:hypothetical protein
VADGTAEKQGEGGVAWIAPFRRASAPWDVLSRGRTGSEGPDSANEVGYRLGVDADVRRGSIEAVSRKGKEKVQEIQQGEEVNNMKMMGSSVVGLNEEGRGNGWPRSASLNIGETITRPKVDFARRASTFQPPTETPPPPLPYSSSWYMEPVHREIIAPDLPTYCKDPISPRTTSFPNALSEASLYAPSSTSSVSTSANPASA